MPLLYSLSDTISLPATLNQSGWVTIVADQDYFLLEMALLPGPGGPDNLSGLVGIVGSQADLPSGSGKGNGPNSFSSTNSTMPANYRQLFLGNPTLAVANTPPLVRMEGGFDVDYTPVLAGIPMGHPPKILRGEILVFAVKNLTSGALKAQWAVKSLPISNQARTLVDRVESQPITMPVNPGQ